MYQHIHDEIIQRFDEQYIFNMDPDTKYFAIGDVHGCLTELKGLVELLQISGEKIHIFLLGDLIDRGPKSMETVLYVADHPELFTVIRGNHEHNFLLELEGKYCRSHERKITHKDFQDLSKKKQDKFLSVIQGSKYLHFLRGPEVNFLMTHAPVEEFATIKFFFDHSIYNMIVGQVTNRSMCMGGGQMDIEMFNETNDDIEKDMILLHGHQSWSCRPMAEQFTSQGHLRHKIYNLDSGCVYGNKLTAMSLEKNPCFYHIDSKFSIK